MVATPGADETGIIAAARDAKGEYYILKDASLRGTPGQWAAAAVDLYHQTAADRLVGEVNNGGDLVELALREADPDLSYRAVRATRGKYLRAEPVAALYEKGKVHHIGAFPELEEQMCSFVPGRKNGSPDRLDALVWAVTELMRRHEGKRSIEV